MRKMTVNHSFDFCFSDVDVDDVDFAKSLAAVPVDRDNLFVNSLFSDGLLPTTIVDPTAVSSPIVSTVDWQFDPHVPSGSSVAAPAIFPLDLDAHREGPYIKPAWDEDLPRPPEGLPRFSAPIPPMSSQTLAQGSADSKIIAYTLGRSHLMSSGDSAKCSVGSKRPFGIQKNKAARQVSEQAQTILSMLANCSTKPRRGRPPKMTQKRPQNPSSVEMKRYWNRSLNMTLRHFTDEEKELFATQLKQVEAEYKMFSTESKDNKNKHRFFWKKMVVEGCCGVYDVSLVRLALSGGQNSNCADVTKGFCALLRTLEVMPLFRRSGVIGVCHKIASSVNDDPLCNDQLDQV